MPLLRIGLCRSGLSLRRRQLAIAARGRTAHLAQGDLSHDLGIVLVVDPSGTVNVRLDG